MSTRAAHTIQDPFCHVQLHTFRSKIRIDLLCHWSLIIDYWLPITDQYFLSMSNLVAKKNWKMKIWKNGKIWIWKRRKIVIFHHGRHYRHRKQLEMFTNLFKLQFPLDAPMDKLLQMSIFICLWQIEIYV